jgi:hypothetical protein
MLLLRPGDCAPAMGEIDLDAAVDRARQTDEARAARN